MQGSYQNPNTQETHVLSWKTVTERVTCISREDFHKGCGIFQDRTHHTSFHHGKVLHFFTPQAQAWSHTPCWERDLPRAPHLPGTGRQEACVNRDQYTPQHNPDTLLARGLVGCSPGSCLTLISTLPNSSTASNSSRTVEDSLACYSPWG